jgi:hypothetical protein
VVSLQEKTTRRQCLTDTVLIGEGDNVLQVLLDAANNVVALSARTPRE